MTRSGLFVTGTDTGVGKTVVGCAIAEGLRGRGVDVGVMKPIETGVGPSGPLDAQALKRAAGVEDPISLVCPQQFALPAAPTVAAEAEGLEVDLGKVDDAYASLRARHEFMLVEGAGGLLVPADGSHTMADLAKRLDLPLLVAARAALGTINHTLLTVEALERRGLRLVGVVVSHAGGPLSEADAQNLDALRQALGQRLVGEIPPLEHFPGGASLDLDAIVAEAAASG